MTDTHSTKNSNESQQVRYAAPRSWIARTGSLIGVVMLAGLPAACGSGAPDVGAAAAAAPTPAQARTVAETHFVFHRLDHAGVNQRSTARDSDLPGASIAVYGESVATHQQAHALAEQGKQLDAVVLVQTRATEAMDAIAAKARENKGSMEAFWDAVKGGAEKAVQGVAGWGKDETNETKLKRVTAEIEKARRPFNASAFGDGNAEARASLAVNLARQASLSETIHLEGARAKLLAKNNFPE